MFLEEGRAKKGGRKGMSKQRRKEVETLKNRGRLRRDKQRQREEREPTRRG